MCRRSLLVAAPKWPILIAILVVLSGTGAIFIAASHEGRKMTTTKKSTRSANDKLIHIRIDELTHRKLKTYAASSQMTIQQLVEELIRSKYASVRMKDFTS
jgi:Sec-independent protein translocase protein TatA